MWKIFITYADKSKVTLTGKQKDIPLRLALKYHKQYVDSVHGANAKYQRYPKKLYPEMSLLDKIKELEQETLKEEEQNGEV